MFLRVVVGLVLVGLAVLALTQVIIPLWKDLPLFPWFRRGPNRLTVWRTGEPNGRRWNEWERGDKT